MNATTQAEAAFLKRAFADIEKRAADPMPAINEDLVVWQRETITRLNANIDVLNQMVGTLQDKLNAERQLHEAPWKADGLDSLAFESHELGGMVTVRYAYTPYSPGSEDEVPVREGAVIQEVYIGSRDIIEVMDDDSVETLRDELLIALRTRPDSTDYAAILEDRQS